MSNCWQRATVRETSNKIIISDTDSEQVAATASWLLSSCICQVLVLEFFPSLCVARRNQCDYKLIDVYTELCMSLTFYVRVLMSHQCGTVLIKGEAHFMLRVFQYPSLQARSRVSATSLLC